MNQLSCRLYLMMVPDDLYWLRLSISILYSVLYSIFYRQRCPTLPPGMLNRPTGRFRSTRRRRARVSWSERDRPILGRSIRVGTITDVYMYIYIYIYTYILHHTWVWVPVFNRCDWNQRGGFQSRLSGLEPTGTTGAFLRVIVACCQQSTFVTSLDAPGNDMTSQSLLTRAGRCPR